MFFFVVAANSLAVNSVKEEALEDDISVALMKKEDMWVDQDASALMKALNIETNDVSVACGHLVFSENGDLKSGDFLIRLENGKSIVSADFVDFIVINANGKKIATGCIAEFETFAISFRNMMRKLVTNSMPKELLARKYMRCESGIGDVCIIDRYFDDPKHKFTDIPMEMHFVRGGTVVRLKPIVPSNDIVVVGTALDNAILEAAGEKPDKAPADIKKNKRNSDAPVLAVDERKPIVKSEIDPLLSVQKTKIVPENPHPDAQQP